MLKHFLKAALLSLITIISISCKETTNDVPECFVGTNFWYGAILGSPEGAPGSDRARLEKELDELCNCGITNLRVLVGADGHDGEDVKVRPALQIAPGQYNEDILIGLDYLLQQMERRGMKAVLYINNSWEWSGGYGTYLEWAGMGVTPNTRRDGYDAFMKHVAQFMTCEPAKELFYNHVRYIVNRYKSSNAIYSWQIGNEPRCFSSDPAVQDEFVKYIDKTSRIIKSIDRRHMVSIGNEGMCGCEGNWDLYERINACEAVDYITIHIWPYNWGWAREASLQDDVQNAITNTDNYIDRSLETAEKLGKNVVIEEFGFPRDNFQFAKSTPTTARDTYYAHLFSRIEQSQKEGGRLIGANFWGWGGLAEQTPGHIYWEIGDDYCGDPSQEQQGLNSVYACDSTTVNMIRAFNQKLNSVRVSVPVQHDWMFNTKKNAKLDVKVECQKDTTVVLEAVLIRDLSLMSGVKDTVVRTSAKAKANTTVSVDFGRLEPGFYQVNITGVEPFNIGCDPESIISPKNAQPDFDEFWAENLAELATVPMDVKMELIPENCNERRNVYRVEMKSLGGASIGGIYAEPVAEGKYPAYVEYMGYGAEPFIYSPDDKPEAIQFLVSVREQGIFKNLKPGDSNGRWIDKGLADKDTYYYKGAFCDVVRAVDFIASREKTDQSRIFGLGESQGGAFSWVAASLDHRFRAMTTAVPFLSDYEDYSKIVWWPVWEVFDAADAEGIAREDLFTTLSYFDIKNFTDKITCPVFMAFGLQDPTCPPHTNFAGYNMVKTDKHYMVVPTCGHGIWKVPAWAEARDAWFNTFPSEN